MGRIQGGKTPLKLLKGSRKKMSVFFFSGPLSGGGEEVRVCGTQKVFEAEKDLYCWVQKYNLLWSKVIIPTQNHPENRENSRCPVTNGDFFLFKIILSATGLLRRISKIIYGLKSLFSSEAPL